MNKNIKYWVSAFFIFVTVIFGTLGAYEKFKADNKKDIEISKSIENNQTDLLYLEINKVFSELGYKVNSIHCKNNADFQDNRYFNYGVVLCVVRTDEGILYYKYERMRGYFILK